MPFTEITIRPALVDDAEPSGPSITLPFLKPQETKPVGEDLATRRMFLAELEETAMALAELISTRSSNSICLC